MNYTPEQIEEQEKLFHEFLTERLTKYSEIKKTPKKDFLKKKQGVCLHCV